MTMKRVGQGEPRQTLSCHFSESPTLRGPPSLNPGKLPSTYFGFETEKNGEAPPVRDVDVERLERVSSSRAVPDTPTPPELAKDGRKLTKREKKEVF